MENTKKVLSINLIVITIVFTIRLILNHWSPIQSDDFTYARSASSLLGYVEYEVEQYLTWTGRFPVHLASRLVLQMPYSAQDLFNTIMLTLVLSLLPLYSYPFFSRGYALSVFTCFLLYFVFHPALGQATFWITGAANYLWPLVLVIFQILIQKETILTKRGFGRLTVGLIQFFCFVLGILNGWMTETLGVILITFGIAHLTIATIRSELGQVCPRAFPFLFGNTIGMLLLVGAPGNAVRLSRRNIEGIHSLLTLERLNAVVDYFLPILLSNVMSPLYFLIAMFALTKNYKKSAIKIAPTTIAFIVGLLSLSLSPFRPPRSLSPNFFLILLAVVQLMPELDWKRCRYFLIALYAYLLLIGAPSLSRTVIGYSKLNEQHKLRLALISQAVENDRTSVCIPEWEYGTLFPVREMFDPYRAHDTASYYGLEKIVYARLGYEYSGSSIELLKNQLHRESCALSK